MTQVAVTGRGVFTIRAAALDDMPRVWPLLTTVTLLVGDVAQFGVGGEGSNAPPCDRGQIRVAEIDHQISGAYGLHVRNAGSRSVGELCFLAVESPARACGLDRLLVHDAVLWATELGLTGLQLIVRPPLDARFRRLGARPVRIEGPCGSVTWPLLRLEMAAVVTAAPQT